MQSLSGFRYDHPRHQIKRVAVRLQVNEVLRAAIATGLGYRAQKAVVAGDANDAYTTVRSGSSKRHDLVSSAHCQRKPYDRGAIRGTYVCSHASRYRSMNGSNEPRPAMNVFHNSWNLVISMAVVRSIVGFSTPRGRTLARDGMGGGFRTLIPHPSGISSELR